MFTTRSGGTNPCWTAECLQECLREVTGGDGVVVIANRQPVSHERAADGTVVAVRSASGLVTALEPLVSACHGVWVAHGSGSADREGLDARDGLAVPTAEPTYRLRRVWLDAREEREYYAGFANEALWPLCHRTPVRPTFRPGDFDAYVRVNQRFASAACDEAAGRSPVMLVQDYHFAMVPSFIRARRPGSTIVAFWHIPWPERELFQTCPWAGDLLRGLLGSSIVGFQTSTDCRHFLDCVAAVPGADVDRAKGSVRYGGRRVLVRAYPISIEWPNDVAASAGGAAGCRAAVQERVHLRSGVQMVLGVDRLDYTKGICEKALAFERLLLGHPEMLQRVSLIQIAEPSREGLAAYRELRARLTAIVARINARFGTAAWTPIVLREDHHDAPEVYAFYRAADVCYVGSLHDGMNLVAKEFVAARDDERGVLVLSRFTGAARQLTGALQVDPLNPDASADILYRALKLAPAEQASRMRGMRAVVAAKNSYWWAGQMLRDAARLRLDESHRTRVTRRMGQPGSVMPPPMRTMPVVHHAMGDRWLLLPSHARSRATARPAGAEQWSGPVALERAAGRPPPGGCAAGDRRCVCRGP